jgi:hypothetical protein
MKQTHGTLSFVRLMAIFSTSLPYSAYTPLHYVLLFPDGRNEWHDDIPLNGFQWDGSGFI